MIEPLANDETSPDFSGLMADILALQRFVLRVQEENPDGMNGNLIGAFASLAEAWMHIYQHRKSAA